MPRPKAADAAQPPARDRLLLAALHLLRAQGLAGTSVDDICRQAGVTKGSFFHHFPNKEALVLATIELFNGFADRLFDPQAPHRQLPGPKARVLAYVRVRAEIIQGEIPDFSCLLGTLLQEGYQSHPTLRERCGQSIEAHAFQLLPDLMAALPSQDRQEAEDLALYIQAVMQGSFVLAKAQARPERAKACIAQLLRHLDLLLTEDGSKKPNQARPSAATAAPRQRAPRRPKA